MNAEDLQSLYSELRGSRAAPAIMDARSLFLDLQYDAALAKLRDSYDKYSESRMRILRQDAEKQVDAKAKDRDRQVKRIKRKQEKAKEILEKFEELMPELEKLIAKQKKKEEKKREQATSREEQNTAESSPEEEQGSPQELISETEPLEDEKAPSDKSEADTGVTKDSVGKDSVIQHSDIDSGFAEQFSSADFDDQVSLVGQRFGFRQVSSVEDIQVDGVYFLRGEDESLLVTIASAESGQPIELVNLATKGVFQVPSRVFLEFGEQRRVVLLLSRDVKVEKQLSDDEGATDPERDKILDMGALSQLMDSAQRSGLVPGADQIAYVRDKEFRLGQYEQALQVIESMYGKFTASVAQRSQRIMREDADIAAGRIKMSPKEIQAKRQRDRAQDQAIERARSRFNRVLDGLRVLLKVGV